MIVYLDTSIVLRALLGQGTSLKEWGQWQAAYSSDLLGLEARRVIDRLRVELALDDRGVAQAQQTLLEIEKGIGSPLPASDRQGVPSDAHGGEDSRCYPSQ